MINFANGLAARQIPVDLLVGRGPDDFRSIVDQSVNIIELQRGMLGSIPALRNYLCREQPDVLLSSLMNANIAAVLARIFGFGVKSKIILREATTPSENARSINGWKSHLLMFLAKRLTHHGDHLISAGEACRVDAVKYYGLDPEKTTTVYSSFINPKFYESAGQPVEHRWFKDGSRIVATMGRVMPVKDFPTLVAALAIVRQSMDAKLIVIGETNRDRTHFELLQQQIRDLNLQDSVDFVGFHQNPFPFLAQSEVYVLSSKFEGLPGALVQAMALGCKLVATDCKSGPREILKDGSRGVLVPVGDSQGIATGILKQLNTDHDRLTGREWTQEFSEAMSIDNLINVFNKTLQNSASEK